MSDPYRLRVTRSTLADFDREYGYSARHFGEDHARVHFRRLVSALESLVVLPKRRRISRRLGAAWRILDFDGLQAAYHIDETEQIVTIAGILGRDRYHELVEVIRARRMPTGRQR